MRKRKAFTLIELLIVIAIIAVLAIIVVMNLANARDKANYAKAKADMKTVSDAMRMSIAGGKLTAATYAVQGSAAAPIAFKDVSPALTSALLDEDGVALLSAVPTPPTSSFAYWVYISDDISSYTFSASTPKSGTTVSNYCTFSKGNVVNDTYCRP